MLVLRGAPPAQGGIQVLGALVGHVSVIMQRRFQQFVEFFVLSVQFLDRMVDIPAACRSLVRIVHTVQQTVEISQVQFYGGYMLCIIQGGLWKNFDDFLHEGVDSAPELDPRPAGTSSTTAVACSLLVLLVLMHLALCSHDCRQLMLRLLTSCTLKSVHDFLRAPVFFSMFNVRNFARVDFLEPSSTHRCECSRAAGGADAGSSLLGFGPPVVHN